MPLKELRDDVRYINLETGEVECTFNECRMKFEPAFSIESPDFDSGKQHVSVFHACTECGRKAHRKVDDTANDKLYRQRNGRNIVVGEEITLEDQVEEAQSQGRILVD